MKQRHGWFGRTACLLIAAGLAAHPALAFYPFGYFSPGGQGGNLVYVTWPFEVLDVNNDGDISGDFDGVPLNFEAGPGGFTETQIQRIFSGYEEWERVGTSYAAFSRGQDLTDPVELQAGTDLIDGINAVTYQRLTDPQNVTNTVATQFFAFVLEPTTIVIDNMPVLFTEPQMIDVDAVFVESLLEPADQDFLFILEGVGTFLGGVALGLNESPLYNLVSTTPDSNGLLFEQEAVTLRNFQGILEPRGVTSSLFDDFVVIDLGNGVYEWIAHDLAPDDIAGITFLYPRQESDLFFDITGYARTRSTTLIPSQPIAGAWIRAYVNANNTSNRVPLVDTFTGLYTPPINPNSRNRFELKGLFKQMETPGGVTFAANYTLTCAEFTPFTDFTPGGGLDTRTSLDSTHGGFPGDGTPAAYTGFGFDSLFPSEVFNESGNILGQQNLSQGTPLKFDIVRREVVSTLSNKSLLEIVGPERIVFGDDGTGASPNTGCPFNQIITAPATISGGGPSAPGALRAFRDTYLLSNALGAFATDSYYRVSPALARFVGEHAFAADVFKTGVSIFTFSLRNPAAILLIAGLTALAAAFRKRFRARAIVAAAALVLGVSFWAHSANASGPISPIKTFSDQVAYSDYVVHGTIETADSHWTPDGKRIVTDVAIRVEDSVKGRINEGGLVYFQLPTGQVGPVVRVSPQIPTFVVGEEIVLFLDDRGNAGLGLVGGPQSKILVKETASETKYVGVVAPPPNRKLREAAAEIKALREGLPLASNDAESSDDASATSADDEATGPITLDEFKDYIRYLDRENRRNQR